MPGSRERRLIDGRIFVALAERVADRARVRRRTGEALPAVPAGSAGAGSLPGLGCDVGAVERQDESGAASAPCR